MPQTKWRDSNIVTHHSRSVPWRPLLFDECPSDTWAIECTFKHIQVPCARHPRGMFCEQQLDRCLVCKYTQSFDCWWKALLEPLEDIIWQQQWARLENLRGSWSADQEQAPFLPANPSITCQLQKENQHYGAIADDAQLLIELSRKSHHPKSEFRRGRSESVMWDDFEAAIDSKGTWYQLEWTLWKTTWHAFLSTSA